MPKFRHQKKLTRKQDLHKQNNVKVAPVGVCEICGRKGKLRRSRYFDELVCTLCYPRLMKSHRKGGETVNWLMKVHQELLLKYQGQCDYKVSSEDVLVLMRHFGLYARGKVAQANCRS